MFSGPVAHLYYELGLCLRALGTEYGAEKTFEKSKQSQTRNPCRFFTCFGWMKIPDMDATILWVLFKAQK
jgi:hypothetical protein